MYILLLGSLKYIGTILSVLTAAMALEETNKIINAILKINKVSL